jgi:predicted ATPase/DNA-binding SARP family transcriptional activator
MLIRLLGEVSAGEDEGSLHPPRGRIATSLLAVLALARGRLVTTESLIDDLWEVPPDTARNAIQVAVSGLRKQFGETLVDGSRVGYRLRTDLVRIDWLEVEQYLATARDRMNTDDLPGAEADAAAAHTLFTGSELAGADSASVRASRGLAVQLRRASAVMWAQALVGLGRRDEALTVLAEESALSPLDEPVHVLLMSALREQGRSTEALGVFESLRRRLDDELGVMPSPDTVGEYQRLLNSGAEVDLDHVSTPRPSVALPNSATPLFGRDAEVEELVDLMRTGHALITLLGPGGIGKTRLGIAAARGFAETEERPALFLDLTLSRSEADSRRLLADLVGSEPDGIVGRLESSRMVLVLDNAEHLLDETSTLVSELLKVPDLRLVVTSRSALELTQERRFEVDGLASEGARSPAVQLLVDRAAFSAAEADVSALELQVLAEQCDGIPLVMELLGSALRWTSPQELVTSLELASIRDGSRNRPDRHASVRAAIDWSVEHLGPDARGALGVLATVRGRFDTATATALIEAIGVSNSQDALAELVDASLVKRIREPGSVTFRILEPIRVVAEAVSPDGAVRSRDAHADIYLRLLARAHGYVANSTDEFDEFILRESPNLAVAIETSWASRPNGAVASIAQLLYGWYRRDRIAEVRDWAVRVLGSAAGTPTERAEVGITLMMVMAGYDGWDNSLDTDFDELNASAELVSEELDDEWHRRWTACNYVRSANANDPERAEFWIDRMRVTSRITAFYVHNAKSALFRLRGDWKEAIEEAEASLRELDPTTQIAQAVVPGAQLAVLRAVVGEVTTAEKQLRGYLDFAESNGLAFEASLVQMNLAFVTSLMGRTRECLSLVLKAMNWSGGNVFGRQLSIYAAVALHASGDDAAAYGLASMVANASLEEPGSMKLTDDPYLAPHWSRLVAELPPLSDHAKGGWDTAAAKLMVADALARLPVDN